MSERNDLYNSISKKYDKLTLTIKEAASELGIGGKELTNAIAAGDIQAKRIGKKTLIPISSLVSFLLGQTSTIMNEKDVDNSAYQTVTLPETTELVEDDADMSKGTVCYVNQTKLWVCQIDIGKSPNGKRIRKSKSFKNEDDARAFLSIEIAKLNANQEVTKRDNNNSIMSSSTTLKDFIEYYLNLSNATATSRSFESYYIVGKKICKEYGSYKLSELTPELLIILLNKFKEQNTSESTLLKIYLLLRMIMNYAVSKKILLENPMAVVKRPKSQVTKADEYKAYTEEELHEIMTAAKAYPEIYPILLVFQNTGMRPGELRAIKWENVDLKNKTISIKNAATYQVERESLEDKRNKKEIIGPTKSAYSVRTLTISDSVVDELKKWRNYLDTSDKYKKARSSDFLFPGVDGDFIKDDALRKMFRKFLKNTGLSDKGYHLYKFRHTMCTNLIKQNVSIPVAQRIMGDNTTDVILKIYTSVNSSDVMAATELVQKRFNQINNSMNI